MSLVQVTDYHFLRPMWLPDNIQMLICSGPASMRFFNPVIPTLIFPQSRNLNGFYRLMSIPNISFESALQMFQTPSSSVNQWKMVG